MKFQQTIDSIIENKVKVEQRLQNEKEKRDQLLSKYTGLIDEQRLYFIAVKAFKEVNDNYFCLIFSIKIIFFYFYNQKQQQQQIGM